MKAVWCKILTAGIVVALAGVLSAAQQAPAQAPKPADLAGVWEITMQSPQGEMKSDATFVQKDDVIKVTMPSPMGDEMKGEGKVKGSEAAWTLTISTPNGDFQLVFKAKIEGEKMTGEIQMGDFGTSTFTAAKKK